MLDHHRQQRFGVHTQRWHVVRSQSPALKQLFQPLLGP
jgi:hypothetical protein